MSSSEVHLPDLTIGGGRRFALIAGPCVIESRDSVLRHAERLRDIAAKVEVPFVFKCSFDKANRTSVDSYRGPGLEAGLRILEEARREAAVPVLTDVHEGTQAKAVAEVVDVLQTPAFLCRQTDFILEVCAAGKPVNLKKGQFLSPWEMKPVVEKAASAGNPALMVTERGYAFGYQNLVTDLRSLVILRDTGVPVVFDATHSAQLPGGQGRSSGGQREFVPFLARGAVAVGVDALFMEVHEDPDRALSDGPNSWPLDRLEGLLRDLVAIDRIVKAAA
ncbi:MAG: 2-dehydro-3-deoxyphosphooctonate aldolase synthase [Candidatus Binatota bacterium]|nr:2-dehydro-3-deoxyphosphooctonate aldolase synthase [Candidatus Binatota bacterium]